ncbi:MAG: hypothetical protein KF785_10610 [Gemmatimonadales bacterium]|nr:hypothetical protein [Gemmatimonadales bacterium]
MTSNQPRDWDKEMAEIDKIIAQTPPAQLGAGSGPAAPAPRTGAAPARAQAPAAPVAGRGARFSTWLRVGLGVALAAAMTQWPYIHACGLPLLLYLGAVGVVLVSGVWGMVSSWHRRMAAAHIVSLAVLIWGGILLAATLLPRIGYAGQAAPWFCS